jgi:hypothetical protein
MRNIPAFLAILLASALTDLSTLGLAWAKLNTPYQVQDIIAIIEPHPWRPLLFGVLFGLACILTLHRVTVWDLVKTTLGLPIFHFVIFQGLGILGGMFPPIGELPLFWIAHGLYVALIWVVACEIMDQQLGITSLFFCLVLSGTAMMLPTLLPQTASAGVFFYTGLGLVFGVLAPREEPPTFRQMNSLKPRPGF